VAGGQIGYNWQVFSRWLVGLELDWQWTPQMNFATASTPASATSSFFNFGGSGFGYALTNETRITNFGTERLRAGMLAGESLWYATGGVAWGTVKDNFAFAGSGASFPPFSGAGAVGSNAVSVSKTRIGWTLGGGVETKLDSRWSAKIEYLYVDLGTVSETLAIPVNAAFTGGGASAAAQHSTHVTDNVIRAGMNYRFF
jgi:outer membrane immunogenic protein